MSMTKRFLEEMELLIIPDDEIDLWIELEEEYNMWLENLAKEQEAYEEMLEINPNFANN